MSRARELSKLGSPSIIGVNYGSDGNLANVSFDNVVVDGSQSVTGVSTFLGSIGVATGTAFHGNITGTAATFSGDVSVGGSFQSALYATGVITARSGIDIGAPTSIGATIATSGDATFAGVVTATRFSGDGAGIGIRTEGSSTGFGVTYLDFRGAGISTFTASSGIATLNITGGGGGGGLNVLSFFFG